MQLDEWWTRQKKRAELKIELTSCIGMLIWDTKTSKYVQKLNGASADLRKLSLWCVYQKLK